MTKGYGRNSKLTINGNFYNIIDCTASLRHNPCLERIFFQSTISILTERVRRCIMQKKIKRASARTRCIRLLKVLIKIGIMFLVMTGLILITKKYMSNADGCEQNSQITSLKRVEAPEHRIHDN